MRGRRCGTVLLESLFAMLILGTAALAFVWMSRESIAAARAAAAFEREVIAASTLLDAATLWPREDLERRLGSRRQGRWLMYIERTSSTLFEVSVTDTASGIMVSSTFFRPETAGGN